jgi:alkaline phosphatase
MTSLVTFGASSLWRASFAGLLLVSAGCESPDASERRHLGWDNSDTYTGMHRPYSGDAKTGTGAAGASAVTATGRRNVIIMIGDGMQMAQEVAASRYLTGQDFGLSFQQLPVRVFKTTWDIEVYNRWADALGVPHYSRADFDPTVGYNPSIGGSKPYPLLADNPERRDYFLRDLGNGQPNAARSSSTATAMSTGIKTDSDNIAWFANDPENGALETSAELLRRLYGMSIGFVTTCGISDATPAGWFAHNRTRDVHAEIFKEMLTRTRPDVVIGGGRGKADFVDETVLEEVRHAGDYVVVLQQSGQSGNAALYEAAIRAKQAQAPLLGIFGNEGDYVGSFQWSVPKHNPGHPEFEPPPKEQVTFADATVAALEVLSQNPNGFFAMFEQEDIDLASHELNFSRMVGSVYELHEGVKAVMKFIDRPGDDIDWSNTSLIVTADHANSYLRFEKQLGKGELPQQENDGGWRYPDGSISYGGGNHTNELIAVYVRGAIEDRVARYAHVYPGSDDIIDDTTIYQLTLDAAWR